MPTTLFRNQFSLENCENVNERITECFSRRGHTNIASGAGNENNVLYTAQEATPKNSAVKIFIMPSSQ
ncbi:MAG: hypothetical protein SPI34_08005 [Opitutales bacterium]|nr:hypothetical protein [Opitutales bacterium]